MQNIGQIPPNPIPLFIDDKVAFQFKVIDALSPTSLNLVLEGQDLAKFSNTDIEGVVLGIAPDKVTFSLSTHYKNTLFA